MTLKKYTSLNMQANYAKHFNLFNKKLKVGLFFGITFNDTSLIYDVTMTKLGDPLLCLKVQNHIPEYL